MAIGRRSPRWAFLEGLDIGEDGDPYLDRLRIIQTPMFSIYLHHIHRADRESAPHDHPWWFASLVLTGGYTEDVWPDKLDSTQWTQRDRGRFSLRCLGRKSAHHIARADGPLWTLVLTGPRVADWGFWPAVPGAPSVTHFVHWKDWEQQQ